MKTTLLFLLLCHSTFSQSSVMKDTSYNFSERSKIVLSDLKKGLAMDTSVTFDNSRNIVSLVFNLVSSPKDSIFKVTLAMLVNVDGIVQRKGASLKLKKVSNENNLFCLKEILSDEESFVDPNGRYHYIPKQEPYFELYWYVVKINGEIFIHFSGTRNKSIDALSIASDWMVLQP